MDMEIKNGMYTWKGTEIGFSFYTNLSAVNKVKFVNTVVNSILDDNYNVILRDLLFDFEIIDIFTDVDLTEIRESVDSLSKIEEFLSETKIVAIVKANMVDGLLETLNKAVEDNLSYRTGVQRNRLSDALSNLLVTLNKKIHAIDTDSLMEVAKKLNLAGDLSTDSILKAYANSDLYKKDLKKTNQSEQ